MQQLYVVDLECRAGNAAAGTDVDALLRRHLLAAMAAAHEGVPDAAALEADGFGVLPARGPGDGDGSGRDQEDPQAVLGGVHDLRWRVACAGGVRALRVDLHEPVAAGARLLTRTTITTTSDGPGGAAHLRVSLAREQPTGQLAPVLLPRLGRPDLVGSVVADPDLVTTCAGQVVDGRMPVVRTAAQAARLVTDARGADRLPLVLVRPGDQDGWAAARRTASELEGLARLVVLHGEGAEALAAVLPELPVPDGGVRLLWPDLAAHHHPAWTAADVAADDPPLATALFRVLAPVSVLARGRDDGWVRASRAAQREEVERARTRTAQARRSGDRAGEVAALEDLVAALHAENEQLLGQWQTALDEVEALRPDAAAAPGLRFEVDHWRARASAAEAAAGPAGPDWSAAPALGRDAQPLFDFLAAASGGALRFTGHAARQWRKSAFAFPELMRDALVRLAQASVDFAAHHGDVQDRLADWFLHGHGLEVALTDSALQLSRRARFTFDGEDLEAVPHVKLGDKRRPSECGRVYFAWTAEPPRFTVDHVGTHR